MEDTLQWHPAFYAGIQIELEEERDNLLFENEHQLGTRPKEIDVFIIKKKEDVPVRKNIGRIFRKYNIIEYKGPKDYISIDDYYKVYAYACLYKSDTVKRDDILITEITITFVCKRYPRKLFGHLENVLKYKIEKRDNGIYILHGNVLPMQVIVTKELSKEENLWLHSLTDELDGRKEAEELVHIYKKHQKNILYESVMEVIVKANHEKFKEVSGMCNALVEIMQPYIDEQVALGLKREEQKIEERKQKIEEQEQEIEERKQEIEECKREMEECKQEIEEREQKVEEQEQKIAELTAITELTRILLAAGRIGDLSRAMDDKEYRKCLYEELALSC